MPRTEPSRPPLGKCSAGHTYNLPTNWVNVPPCPECGLATVHVDVSFDLSISAAIDDVSYQGIGGKYNGKGKHKFAVEGFHKRVNSEHPKSSGRVYRDWMVHRVANMYREIVTDTVTGEELHRCEEPLDQHYGGKKNVKA